MGIYANNIFAPAIKINQPIIPRNTLAINGTGFYNVYSYSSISVNIEDLLDKMVTTGLTDYLEYTDLSASKVNDFAFAGQKISNINMPVVTTIGKYAFYNIRTRQNTLVNLNFPNCTSIDKYTFARSAAINNSSTMELILNSNISFLPSFCFCSNTYLTKINNNGPINCLSVYGYCFSDCYNLQEINLPSCTNIYGNYPFGNCKNLINVSIPLCSSIGYYGFQGCQKLSIISMPACVYIGYQAFYQCFNLLSVYLNVSSVPSLNNINAFQYTPISTYTTSTGGVYGSIFVPTSLYSSFISATNWATYSSRIVSMNF